jgi:hypothetical protein
MSVNLIGMQSQAQFMIEAIRHYAMSLRGALTNIYRRYRPWILSGAALFVVVIAGWMLAHRQSDAALSPDFRTSARQAYEAISSCENYKPYGGDSWQARQIDAELSLAEAAAHAKTRADFRAAMALSNFLDEVKLVHLARQVRNPKTARHDNNESTREFTRELRSAKQKAQTAIQS